MAVSLGMCISIACSAFAQDTLRWRIDAGLTFSHFQQQVKAEIGDPRGERLVLQTEFGLLAMGTYRVWEYLQGGLFLQYDQGTRRAARFDRIDPVTGKTVTKDQVGGPYSEFWIGPFIRGEWKNLVGEFGWGLFGVRSDDGRTDLASTRGDTTGTINLLPSVALFAALGASVPLENQFSLVVRLEYRLRYYKGREGEPFVNNIKHGTQNITPFVGLSWKF